MRTGLKSRSGMSTAYARYAEEDGDGLTQDSRDAENVLGTSPNRTLNGGFRWISNRYQNFQSEIRFDFTDYQHQYYVSPKDSLLSVITESASDFNLSYHDILHMLPKSLFGLFFNFIISTRSTILQ